MNGTGDYQLWENFCKLQKLVLQIPGFETKREFSACVEKTKLIYVYKKYSADAVVFRFLVAISES